MDPLYYNSKLWLLATVTFSLLIFADPAVAKPYFEDGYLGLTRDEVHEKLGLPHAIRSRKAALRVFHYYTVQDWEKYFKKLVSPENGEDVYTYNRNGVNVRYSFVYTPDLREDLIFPTLYAKRVEIEFTPAASIKSLPDLVYEFKPPTDSSAPAFRSNLWVLIFKGPPSQEAELIVKKWNKEEWDWSLAFQLFSVQGIPDHLTTEATIDRLEFGTQSFLMIKRKQRHTHEPILNPYSKEFANLPDSRPKLRKKIPIPQYAD